MEVFTKNSSYKVIRITDDPSIKLTFNTYYEFEKRNFDIINIPDSKDLLNLIYDNNGVDAIVIQFRNSKDQVPEITKLPLYYIRKVYHYDTDKDYGIDLALRINHDQLSRSNDPLFSVTTPLYNTNIKYFNDAYESLCAQSIDDWEWVLVDDSPNELIHIKEFLAEVRDIRIRYYRIAPTNGNIGLSKWRANCMARGKWLVELDHDDKLSPWCLQTLYDASVCFPQNKFIYSDNTTIDANGNITECLYGDYFCFGYGKSYKSGTPDHNYIRTDSAGPINNATVRHIVGMPNHVRCWERNFYFSIGGHNQDCRIADDYELLVRTFLHTKMTHINACCYEQRFDGSNSQDIVIKDSDGQGNREDIQRRVRLISIYYDRLIHDRLIELGMDDREWIVGDPFQTAQRYQVIHPVQKAEDTYNPHWS